ncbi:TadE/TadG family type IV pilus assembly protein [Actinophytocola oryzae]|uniref:TadE-like protein n=1 Tax=Actinophytocola oryzae TaxID=502181 RepID=A0A4R7V5S1_9PSEU|nr:TadE/TadG family type IV pilus assembly protein [Actinophytocola oryzae]TDV44164.1 TadE-like protein [Actinophytocola oryzae]
MTWRSDRGSVTAEMTVLTPLLVLLLVVVAVVVHRGVSARLRLDTVAHQAARAASMERTAGAADAAAQSAADTALAQSGVVCESRRVRSTINDLIATSTITVTVACLVDLTDAVLPALSTTWLSSTAIEPIDTWREAPR